MKCLKKVIILTIIFPLLFGCYKSSEHAKRINIANNETATPTEAPKKVDETIERKLIKEGDIEFKTEDINATRKKVFEAVKKYHAYVASDKTYKSSIENRNTIVIRVPADNFDKLLNDATQEIEKFDRKEINVKDVTEEFVDIQARLKTKKELEQRYLELLKQAKNVSEILEIEKQIGQLRADIESIEGRLKYLQNKVAFSTLTISFYETIAQSTGFGQKFKNGFKNGWDNLIWFFVFLINIWPFIIIGIALVFSYKKYLKNRKS